jgi:N-acetylglutamate synthase-like GNAT family acetyltransferase
LNIRKGTEADIPGIVELLKISLGESFVPKSADLWRWKHLMNPFGPSPVLVAEEGNTIIGVRAFLKWQWISQGKKIRAVRAVDTATHPKHQGKGIFKKLTLQGVEEAKSAGISFVFNTPNESSKPGYLKMGWIPVGRIPLKLKINPLSYKSFATPYEPEQDWGKVKGFLSQVVNPVRLSPNLHTDLSPEYLEWRYNSNPLFAYNYISDYESYLLFYRIKEHAFGLEWRLVDFFINTQTFTAATQTNLKAAFRKVTKEFFLVSASACHYNLAKKMYPAMGILPVLERGPILTLRNLSLDEKDFSSLSKMNNLGFSLGDMELF